MSAGELTAEQVSELDRIANVDGAGWPDRRPLDLDPNAAPEPPDYLVDGRIERGTVTVLAGDTGAAKSWTAAALLVATVEGGEEWLGYELRARHRRALAIDEENPERLVRARLRALGLSAAGVERLRYFHRLGVRLGEGDWIEWLRSELAREPADLLTIDTGTAAVAADLVDNAEVAGFYRDHLRPLAADTGAAIVLLLHERKPPAQGPRGARTMATLGARSWIGQADVQLMLARRGEPIESRRSDGSIELESRFTLEVGKLRDGGATRREIVCVRSELTSRRALVSAEIRSEGEPETPQTAAEHVAELLAETPGMTGEQLRTETGRSERTVRDALSALDAVAEGRPKRWRLPELEPEQGELV